MSATVTNSDAALDGNTLLTAEGNQTIEGLKSFDRGTSAPFAVVSGAAKVNNLDADFLDGEQAADFHDATQLVGDIPDANFPATLPAASGENLTALNATNISTGTLAEARLTPRIRDAEVALTDGATPALDAALGKVFTLIAAGDRTIAVPTNPVAGQSIIIRHFASGGARTLALNTGAGGFRFGTDITGLLQTASGKTDYIGCVYNATDSKWDVVGYVQGY